MAWRLAKSLETLRSQVNAAYQNRSKASDGTIGDAAHARSASDHNPNAQGVVCALDLTHDPANGFDAHALAERQRVNPHPNLKYIVSRGRIASRKHGWTWRASSGHFNHVHFSVGVGSDGKSQQPYDDTTKWDIDSPAPSPAHPSVPSWGGFPLPSGHYFGVFNKDDSKNHSGKGNTRDQGFIAMIQREVSVPADGLFGNQTRGGVINYQKARGLKPDGLFGAKSWNAK